MKTTGVEKVLVGGSAKQRALLLVNHVAAVNMGGPGLLSDGEFQALTDSFKKASEIETYNAFRGIFDKVQVYLTNLSQFRLSYMNALTRLEKLIIMRRSNTDFEDFGNRLFELIPEKDRSRAQKIAKEFNDLSLFRNVKIDGAGYIQTNSRDAAFDQMIQQCRKQTEDEQVHLKTAIYVIKDFIDEKNFKVKVFQAFIKNVEIWAKSKSEKGITVAFNARNVKTIDDPKLRELAMRHLIEPDYDSVEIDQKKYQALRESYLDA